MQAWKQTLKQCAVVTCIAMLAACAPQPQTAQQASTGPITYTPPARGGDTTRPMTEPVPPARTVRVALLVPLSGRNSDLGKAMQDAATLALYDKYAALSPSMAATRVEILPKDTGDTPESAALAAQEAVKEGAVVLLGPIFGDAVTAVAPVAKSAGKQVISFSNNAAVAGPGVYVFGFSPEQQTARVVSHMVSQKKQVAALVPNNTLGQTVLAAAKSTASSQGGAIAPVSMYLPQGMGAGEAVDAMLKEGTPFQAVLLPEVGSTLDTLLSTLAARGVSGANTQFIGTGLWDDPAVISQHNLEGALLASSPPAASQGFVNRFRNAYGYTPPRIASLAYDAVALSVTLATSGRNFDADTLTSPGGFSGPANGIFRFRANGQSDRGLAVLRVRGGGYEMVSPPPSTFR